MRIVTRTLHIPRLWKLTALMTLGFVVLALGSVYAMRALPHPGCIVVSSSFTLDLLSGRTQRFSTPTYYYVGMSPDGEHQLDATRTEVESNEHAIQLWHRETMQRQLIQTGVLPSNLTNTPSFAWSPDGSRVAYLWQSMDEQYHLSVVDGDGNNQQTVPFFELDDEELEITHAYIFGWSADNRYLVTGMSYLVDTQDNSFTFWSMPDLRRVSTPLDDQRLLNAAWSQNGHRFAAVARKAKTRTSLLYLFTPEEDAEVAPIDLPYFTVDHIAWSPNDQYVTLAQFVRSTSVYWNYDLYSAAGEPLYLGLTGGIAFVASSSAMIMGAQWSQDSQSWVYLMDGSKGDQLRVDLVALDIETGLHRVIAPNLVFGYLADMFFVDPFLSTDNPLRPSAFASIPTGQRILIPHWKQGKIAVELADLDGNNRVTLVEAADGLMMGDEFNTTSRWWSWRGDHISLVWATYNSGTRAAYLTVAVPDGSFVYTSEGYEDILDARRTYNQNWIGFLGKRNGEWALELYDVESRKLHHLLDGLDTANGWEVIDMPNQNAVFVLIQPTRNIVARSQLYYVPLDGGEVLEITDHALSYPAWSPDGERVAVLRQKTPKDGVLEVMDIEEKEKSQIFVPERIGSSPYLGSWSYCEV